MPILSQHQKRGEKYLDHALPWDQTEPVKYTSFSSKSFNLDMIRESSRRRVELAPELQAIAKEAKLADERSMQTAVSLILADLRKSLTSQLRYEKKGLYDDKQVPTTDEEDMKKDDVRSWKDEVKMDPYVEEAMNIIVDIKRP